jgi:hypothetical protein
MFRQLEEFGSSWVRASDDGCYNYSKRAFSNPAYHLYTRKSNRFARPNSMDLIPTSGCIFKSWLGNVLWRERREERKQLVQVNGDTEQAPLSFDAVHCGENFPKCLAIEETILVLILRIITM